MGNSTKFERLMESNPRFLDGMVYAWFLLGTVTNNYSQPSIDICNAYRQAGGSLDHTDHQHKARDRLARSAQHLSPRFFVRRAMKLGFIEQAMEVSRRLDQIGWPP